MRITFFCPDTHLRYRGDTPEKTGVGGGVTARIYLARALARGGHEVTVVANTDRPHKTDGATFLPLDTEEPLEGDVVVVNTTGGPLDAGAITDRKVSSRRVELWVGGRTRLNNLDRINPDGMVVPSNDLRRFVVSQWPWPKDQVAVVYNGVNRSLMPTRRNRRDLYQLLYTSHPYKGLESAIAVLDLLRARNPRYSLHVYGGAGLWGENDRDLSDRARGVEYHGLTNQTALTEALGAAGFSLHLQGVPEAFGIALVEAQVHGALVVASPVGAFAELVEDHRNGFVVEGDHRTEPVREEAAALISSLNTAQDFADTVRANGAGLPWDWDLAARTWVGWWAWKLDGAGTRSSRTCLECGEHFLLLADGRHCPGCGRFEWK